MVEPSIRFILSPNELDILLNETLAVDDSVLSKLRFGMAKEDGIHFSLGRNEFEYLMDGLAEDLDQMEPGKIRTSLEELYYRLDVMSLKQKPSTPGHKSMFGEHEDMEKLIEEMSEYLGPDAPVPEDMDAFVDFIQSRFPMLGEIPLASLGGLTSNQILHICKEGWWGEDSYIFLNNEVDPDLLLGSRFLHNAFVFLDALDREKGAPATDAKNLKRVFVAKMLDSMMFKENYVERIRSVSKVINEQDVWPLHILRVICELSGLVLLRKKRFSLTRKGKEFLKARDAVKLYHLLFDTFFRKFNLGYLDTINEAEMSQTYFPFCLYHLSRLPGDEPMSHKDLTVKVLPEPLIEELDSRFKYPQSDWLVISRYLQPLEEFGLVSLQRDKIGTHEISPTTWVRKRPLFDAFIRVKKLAQKKSPKDVN